jgi:hypothetical protein
LLGLASTSKTINFISPKGKAVDWDNDEYGSILDVDWEIIPLIRSLQGKMAGMIHPGETGGGFSQEEGEFSILSTDTVSQLTESGSPSVVADTSQTYL